jgi:hypothetical protein
MMLFRRKFTGIMGSKLLKHKILQQKKDRTKNQNVQIKNRTEFEIRKRKRERENSEFVIL